jgi:hypothetical protein
MVASQIKFWVFGAVGAVGLYFLSTALWGDQIGLGITLIGAAIGALALGTAWNIEKEGEKAATYHRQARDEEARQALMATLAKGAKQIEGPKPVGRETGLTE